MSAKSIVTIYFFQYSVGKGGWVNNGVRTVSNSSTGALTRVQCASTHLTSFAVLVDVAGGLRVSYT